MACSATPEPPLNKLLSNEDGTSGAEPPFFFIFLLLFFAGIIYITRIFYFITKPLFPKYFSRTNLFFEWYDINESLKTDWLK
jgi:steroid 5-alpha reductase family enzyme